MTSQGKSGNLTQARTHSELFYDSVVKWQSADWGALSALKIADVQDDPDRDQLALFIAAAHNSLGAMQLAQEHLDQALVWGVDDRLAARMMISAANNSLGCAAAALQDSTAPMYFARSIDIIESIGNTPLTARVRYVKEATRLGLSAHAPRKGPSRTNPTDSTADTNHKTMERTATEVAMPFIIVIAGVPRSGSTWLYNAVRMICQAVELNTYACWVGDYDPNTHSDHDVHLVKLHDSKELTFLYDKILTTQRNLDERLASILRMGWVDAEPVVIKNAAKGHALMHSYWEERSNLEIPYAEINNAPFKAIAKIANQLGIPLYPDDHVRIAKSLNQLKVPTATDNKYDHDRETLLHPGHRADPAEREKNLRYVRDILAQPDT